MRRFAKGMENPYQDACIRALTPTITHDSQRAKKVMERKGFAEVCRYSLHRSSCW